MSISPCHCSMKNKWSFICRVFFLLAFLKIKLTNQNNPQTPNKTNQKRKCKTLIHSICFKHCGRAGSYFTPFWIGSEARRESYTIMYPCIWQAKLISFYICDITTCHRLSWTFLLIDEENEVFYNVHYNENLKF